MPEIFLDQLQGERAGVADHFEKDVVTIGRSDDCDLCFDEMGVSWDHAEFRWREGDWWVIDRGSTNGSYVNEERAHNARLKDGDVLRFGKKGPVMKFRVSPILICESSGEAPAAPPPRQKKKRRVPSELEIPVPDLAPPPRGGGGPGDRQSDLPAAAMVLGQGSGAASILLVGLGLAVAGCLVLLGLLYMEHHALQTDLGRAEDLAKRTKQDYDKLKAESRRQVQRARDQGREEAVESAQVARDSAQRVIERQQRDLERADRRARDASSKVEGLRRELSLNRKLLARARSRERERKTPAGGGRLDWKQINRNLTRSVLFVATTFHGKKKDGTVVPLATYGTGFFASSQGHIVTNKHVIQPWKFRQMAVRLARDGIQVDPASYQVHVWRGGTRFRRFFKGKKRLDITTGFSTARGTLQVIRTAPDRWQDVSLSGKGPRIIRVHAQGGNADLAILRARASRVVPIPAGRTSSVEKLDEVLVVGFPAGPSVMEGDLAVTSPAKGHVRKVEKTILVSASMIPGNSGGPLINREGAVIGVCTRVVKGTESLGFCIRIEHAMELLHGGSWK